MTLSRVMLLPVNSMRETLNALALVDVDVEVDEVLGVVEARYGRADEVDVAQLAVGLAELLQSLAEDGGVEVIAVLLGKLRTQNAEIRDRLIALEGDAAQAGSARPLRPA